LSFGLKSDENRPNDRLKLVHLHSSSGDDGSHSSQALSGVSLKTEQAKFRTAFNSSESNSIVQIYF